MLLKFEVVAVRIGYPALKNTVCLATPDSHLKATTLKLIGKFMNILYLKTDMTEKTFSMLFGCLFLEKFKKCPSSHEEENTIGFVLFIFEFMDYFRA